MIRQRRLITVAATFLIGCAFLLLVVGCSGTRSEAPKEKQGRTAEATSEEQARCDGTRTIEKHREAKVYTTNDLPGCPKGGLLLGTDKADKLYGGEGDDEIRGLGAKDIILGGEGEDEIRGLGARDDISGGEGEDEIRGLGAKDYISGGEGEDVLHGGPGDDPWLSGADGDDVIYGGDGNDTDLRGGEGKDILYGGDGNDFLKVGEGNNQPDKLYCGEGKDLYVAYKNDFVSSSCETKTGWGMA